MVFKIERERKKCTRQKETREEKKNGKLCVLWKKNAPLF